MKQINCKKVIWTLAHWSMAGLIMACFYLAFSFKEDANEHLLFTPENLKLINQHKWAGVLVLLMVLPRVLAGIFAYKPSFTVESIKDKAAVVVHKLLYVLMLTVPLSGYLMSNAKGFPIVLFGSLQLPMVDLISKNVALAPILTNVHKGCAMLLLVLLVTHVGGAILRIITSKKKS